MLEPLEEALKMTKIIEVCVAAAMALGVTGCDFDNRHNHNCKAIAKAISTKDDSGLRDEYDQLLHDDLIKTMPDTKRYRSYSGAYKTCRSLED